MLLYYDYGMRLIGVNVKLAAAMRTIVYDITLEHKNNNGLWFV